MAANLFSRYFPMLVTAGSIPPAKVLILGAGVAGLQAVATARRLGAVVEVFDTRPAVKEEVMSLGAKFIEVEGAADASKAGGYSNTWGATLFFNGPILASTQMKKLRKADLKAFRDRLYLPISDEALEADLPLLPPG